MDKIRLFFSRAKRLAYYYREKHSFKMGNTLSHVTYCIAGNSGDTALSWCVRHIFNTNGIGKRWNIIAVTDGISKKVIDKINRTSGIVIGGGGLFLPDTNANEISGWQWAISEEQVSNIEKPIIVYSVGYNYFPGQVPNELFIKSVKNLVDRSAFFGLRNYGSVNAVRELVGDSLKDKVLYQPCITTVIRKIYRLPKKRRTNTIAFNLAFDRADIRFGKNKDDIVNGIIASMRAIREKGYKVILVAHMKEDLEALNYTDEFELVDTSRYLPLELFEFYNDVDLVIGMRGHAQMIPFGLNCAIISLCTHQKMKWFLEDIGCSEWGIDLRDKAQQIKEEIISKFEYIYEENYEQTQKRLIEEQEKLYKITVENIKKINYILQG